MPSSDQKRAGSLRAMAAGLLRIADELDAAGSIEATQAKSGKNSRPATGIWLDLQTELILQKAADIYKFRQRRAQLLPAELFGEPGWDILLDLFMARLQKRRVSVTSACIGSRVPPTTALRWISMSVDRGILERTECPNDQRVSWVKLSDPATKAMIELLKSEIGASNHDETSISDYVLASDLN